MWEGEWETVTIRTGARRFAPHAQALLLRNSWSAALGAFGVMLAICALATAGAVSAQSRPQQAAQKRWWPEPVEKILALAGDNRTELTIALAQVPSAQREGLRFLIENMPEQDLRSLSSRYLLENVALAYEAWQKAPWKAHIPREVFLNDILPYSCLNEARDASRRMLREKSLPLIAGCTTPAEAAQRLNQKLFPLLNARYSTERKRPDQSPLETIESGKATCSGLSILLVDACRAVGIPARVVGTPLWANLRGNHTWVEVWDSDWHFTGAAEQDPAGLDRGWFVGDASQARKEIPEHAIYASSFKKTGTAFPLVWAPGIQWVPAVNVTDRYTSKIPPADPSKARVLVKVTDHEGKRVAAKVTIREAGKSEVLFEGISKDESADLNDFLKFQTFRVCPPAQYELVVEFEGKTVRRKIKAGAEVEEILTISLP